MKKNCLARAALAAAAALLVGCAMDRAQTRFELDPLEGGGAAREPLPDELERLTAQLLSASLDPGADPAVTADLLGVLQRKDAERSARGEAPSGLVDNALDVFNAARGEAEFTRFAEQMLASGDADPALRRRLREHLDSRPLRVAEQRLGAQRRRRVALLFNRLVGPLVRGLAGDPTAALEGGRALLYSYTVVRSRAQASTEERQALRAYNEFLRSNPGSPAAGRVAQRVAQLSGKLRDQRLREAYGAVRASIAAERPDAALLHLARAEQISPEDPRTQPLRELADAEMAKQEQRLRTTLAADANRGSAFASLSGGSQEPIVAELLQQPLADFAEVDGRWAAVDADLRDELRFIQASGRLARGEEDAYFRELRELAREPGNMARHAASALETPSQNPYAVFRGAVRGRRRQLLRFALLGDLANGLPPSALPQPLRLLSRAFELPYYVLQIASLPFRLVQLPAAAAQLAGPVIDGGELYLDRFPQGQHSAEVRDELESIYVKRGQWGSALALHEARPSADPERIQDYRSRVAQRTLEFARLPDRPLDVRLAVYVSLVREYGDTEAGRAAGREIDELRRKVTPQSIRLTRAFLRDHPEVWGPGALGLRAELLDGEGENGELAEDGLRLIGRNYIELAFEKGEPVQRPIPEENFVRFVSLLEDVRYRTLATDSRERPQSDPQLDLFLESARLGLLDETPGGPRPTRADTVMMSSGEKFSGTERESMLPIELVVRGGLSDAGLGALPRLKLPEESEDAFLYK
jgi:hypothetical protein